MLIIEIGANAIPSAVHDKLKNQSKDGKASDELQIFSFESISVATSDFSTQNKLGEGGFGPVYKVSYLTLSLNKIWIYHSNLTQSSLFISLFNWYKIWTN